MHRTMWLVAALIGAGCTSGASPYEADWDPNGPVAGGKADGLIDILPVLALDGPAATGDVGGNRSELYVIDLQRTDRVEISMEVTSGDLNPHISFFFGTSSYVSSESWEREGDTLKKVYVAESAGRYLVAARAYHEEGTGGYALSAHCLGGPCAGEHPPPWSELTAQDAATCISRARRCAFSELPRYGGVGPARAAQLMTECLGTVSLDDGSSCATACEWKGDSEGDYDDAAPLCRDIEQGLIFYADQPEACLTVLDGCMADCYAAAWDGSAEEIYDTTEARCWSDGFNGTCDSYARRHEACGGTIRDGSARECTALCHATTGAHVDDLDTLCSSDTDCDDYCEVDLGQASESCGGLDDAHRDCLVTWLDDNEAWICEDALYTAIGGTG